MFQDMIKHRSKILLTLLAVIFLTLSSCASLKKVKDINITSVGVESYSFSGLRSINAVLAIGIDNPTFAFRVTRLNGILKYKGEDFPINNEKVGVLSQKLYDTLYGMQTGIREPEMEGWVVTL